MAAEAESDLVVLVSGSRDWTDHELIRKVLRQLPSAKNRLLIHGDCRGCDRIAAYIGLQEGFKVKSFPAKWWFLGQKAGPIRNTEMLNYLAECRKKGQRTFVVAFHDNLEKSKGTADLVKKAEEMGFLVPLYRETSSPE